MTFRAVRASKFRHVFGNVHKKEEGFDGIRITRNAWDSNFCSVNPKFIAIALEAQGGGAFTVIPLDKPGRLDLNFPKVSGHSAAVLDIQFCPYNDQVIASCSEDCTIKVWQIPENGLEKNLSEPVVTLIGHQRRVGIVEWHPTVEHLLYSAGFDYLVIAWDVSTGDQLKQFTCHTDTIYCMSFSWDGTLLATTSKDKKLRVMDARTGEVKSEGQCHEGTKASRCCFTGELNLIFTTGFSKMSERQYGVWNPEDVTNPLKLEMIDTSSGVLFTYYDNDTQMMYIGGKGDGNIRYYEMDTESPYCHFLSEYKSKDPQRGLGFMPKRGLNVGECQVARFYKLQPKGFVEPISFIVPRKSTMFQEDIFPPTKRDEPVCTIADWLAGADSTPSKVSLKEGYEPPARAEMEKVEAATAAPLDVEAPPKGEKELLKAWHSQREEIKQLKAQLASAEIKIRQLSS
eukprot:m.319729 g.319729  ORF g.319729 m.319729 type:complete len:457 (-) comp23391_c0_seq1:165-1535(-)